MGKHKKKASGGKQKSDKKKKKKSSKKFENDSTESAEDQDSSDDDDEEESSKKGKSEKGKAGMLPPLPPPPEKMPLVGALSKHPDHPPWFKLKLLEDERPDLISSTSKSNLESEDVELLDTFMREREELQPGDLVVVEDNMDEESRDYSRYEVLLKYNEGRYSSIYIVAKQTCNDNEETIDNTLYAMKIGIRKESSNAKLRFKRELAVLKELTKAGARHCPHLIDSGRICDSCYIVMTLVDRNLEKLKESVKGVFRPTSVYHLAAEALAAIEELHVLGYVHRDIKPTNFCIGVGLNAIRLFLIDFGDTVKSGKTIKYGIPDAYSLPYMAIDIHKRTSAKPKVDLEAWFYTFVEMLNPNVMTWRRMHNESEIAEAKSKFWQNMAESLAQCSPQVIEAAKIVNSTSEKANFAALKRLMEEAKNSHLKGAQFTLEWVKEMPKVSQSPKRSEKPTAGGDIDKSQRSMRSVRKQPSEKGHMEELKKSLSSGLFHRFTLRSKKKAAKAEVKAKTQKEVSVELPPGEKPPAAPVSGAPAATTPAEATHRAEMKSKEEPKELRLSFRKRRIKIGAPMSTGVYVSSAESATAPQPSKVGTDQEPPKGSTEPIAKTESDKGSGETDGKEGDSTTLLHRISLWKRKTAAPVQDEKGAPPSTPSKGTDQAAPPAPHPEPSAKVEAVTAPTKSVEQQPEAEEKKVDAPVSVFHKLGMRLRKKATVAEKESNFGESEEKAAQGKAADQVAQGKAAEQTATVPATEVEPATTAATTTTTAGEVVSSEVQVESEGTKNGSGTSIFHKLSKRFKKKTASKPEEKPAEETAPPPPVPAPTGGTAEPAVPTATVASSAVPQTEPEEKKSDKSTSVLGRFSLKRFRRKSHSEGVEKAGSPAGSAPAVTTSASSTPATAAAAPPAHADKAGGVPAEATAKTEEKETLFQRISQRVKKKKHGTAAATPPPAVEQKPAPPPPSETVPPESTMTKPTETPQQPASEKADDKGTKPSESTIQPVEEHKIDKRSSLLDKLKRFRKKKTEQATAGEPPTVPTPVPEAPPGDAVTAPSAMSTPTGEQKSSTVGLFKRFLARRRKEQAASEQQQGVESGSQTQAGENVEQPGSTTSKDVPKGGAEMSEGGHQSTEAKSSAEKEAKGQSGEKKSSESSSKKKQANGSAERKPRTIPSTEKKPSASAEKKSGEAASTEKATSSGEKKSADAGKKTIEAQDKKAAEISAEKKTTDGPLEEKKASETLAPEKKTEEAATEAKPAGEAEQPKKSGKLKWFWKRVRGKE